MSRIEQLIGEIEEYIDSCKYQALSNTKILVNKEEMEELLVELRLRVPDEIKKYQKIISQQDAILSDAKSQADTILADAKQKSEQMLSENEIMQQAYAQANALVQQAQNQAESIVNNAVSDANSIRTNAIRYTDDMLASLEAILSHSMDGAQSRFNDLMTSLKGTYDIVSTNRRELSQSFSGQTEETVQQQEPAAEADANAAQPEESSEA